MLELFSDEQLYNFKHVGNFGQFVSGCSFPIEYLLTTFSPEELSKLTFFRELSPDSVNFELLMQREIDEQRVCQKMEPYLNPSSKPFSDGETYSKAVYFPPLLAAIVPIKGGVMETYYTGENCKMVTDDTKAQTHPRISREWHGLFKLTYLLSQNPRAYRLQVEKDGNLTEVRVQKEPVQFEANLTSDKQVGVALVIIDGQHRLFALKQVYKKHPELLENIDVPVCILFAPESTVTKKEAYAPARVFTVPEVCRGLFVDINSTAELVGGHLNILLSDNTIGSLTCRQFCDYIFKQRGSEGLAVIEWNTNAKKASNQIIRTYSLTSVSIIYKALELCFVHRQRLLKYILQLDEVAKALYLTGDDSTPTDGSKIQWNNFTLSQKTILEKQVRKYLVPCLELLFFGNQEFTKAFEIFCHQLKAVKSVATSEQSDTLEARFILNQVLDYIPIKESQSYERALLIYRDFEVAVKQKREASVSPLLQYALFQRALFEAWAQVLDIARTIVPNPLQATQGFVQLLDLAFRDQGAFFSFERLYMQQTVFLGNKFIAREGTRKILTNLLIAHLANPFYSKQVVNEMSLAESEAKKLAVKLEIKGQVAVSAVLRSIELARKKHFSAAYRFDLSIGSQERDDLIQAEEELKRHRQEVKKGQRLKTEVSKQFDIFVADSVKANLELATAQLKKHLFVQK
jgi:hypothetical protein